MSVPENPEERKEQQKYRLKAELCRDYEKYGFLGFTWSMEPDEQPDEADEPPTESK